jgi:CBS domain containing-hemolysin-like protein
VLRLKDTKVRAIMLPIDEVDGVDESASYEQVMETVARTYNTRYPVYRGELPSMVGLLLAKDLLVHQEGAKENWLQYVRPLMRCRETLEVDELLRDMQIQRSHMAAVEDEHEAVVGIVTMEDVLEEIVGEIYDEFDDDEGDLILELRPGHYWVHGSVDVDDLCKVINVDLPHGDAPETLQRWFDARWRSSNAPARRLRISGARLLHRGGNRYEILVKQSFKEALQRPEA